MFMYVYISGEDCWGHGTCVNGGCACLDGWSGEACDVRQSVMPTLTADSPAQPALALAPAPAMAQSPAPTQQAYHTYNMIYSIM